MKKIYRYRLLQDVGGNTVLGKVGEIYEGYQKLFMGASIVMLLGMPGSETGLGIGLQCVERLELVREEK